MTEHEEIIIYDTMVQIQERAPILCQLLNDRSTPAERDAYRRGIYAAVVRLGSLFTPAAGDDCVDLISFLSRPPHQVAALSS